MTVPDVVTSLRRADCGVFKVIYPALSGGGEGVVYKLARPPGQVLKHYKPDVLEKKGARLAAKIQAMIDNPPVDPTASQGHVSLTWPTEAVVDRSGHFAGYLMPIIDMASAVELHMISNPADRKRSPKAPRWVAGFTWEYLLRVATNLASATQALHNRGYVIGDFNERNVLVHMNALVTLIDCDSMQVPGPAGTSLLCEVLRPEYTAPELLHANLSTEKRAPESDLFPLAVHIYQLLMEGRHPYAGIWHGQEDKPERHQLAERGLFVQNGDQNFTPQAGTPPFRILTQDVQKLFVRAFVDGAKDPNARPSGLEWYRALQALAAGLVTCTADASHRYAGHLGPKCPWCELGKGSQVAIGQRAVHQAPLPPAVAAPLPPQQPRLVPVWHQPPPPPVAHTSWPPQGSQQWPQGWVSTPHQQWPKPQPVNQWWTPPIVRLYRALRARQARAAPPGQQATQRRWIIRPHPVLAAFLSIWAFFSFGGATLSNAQNRVFDVVMGIVSVALAVWFSGIRRRE